jgi:plasmid stabilization system protein ParE
MKRAVVISQRAANEIQEAHDWWAERRSALQAARWYDGLLDAIEGLRESSGQHSVVANAADFPFEVRELLFGLGRRPTHRALYTIRPDSIYVLTLRHVSQGPVGLDDLL